MLRIENGHAVQVPDDARVTPDLVVMRDCLNSLLRHLSANPEDHRKVYEQFLAGTIGNSGFDWYADASQK